MKVGVAAKEEALNLADNMRVGIAAKKVALNLADNVKVVIAAKKVTSQSRRQVNPGDSSARRCPTA